jgi:hypothetical protein
VQIVELSDCLRGMCRLGEGGGKVRHFVGIKAFFGLFFDSFSGANYDLNRMVACSFVICSFIFI